MHYSFFLVFLVVAHGEFASSFFEKSDKFFAKYVREGKVDYASIKENAGELEDLVREVAELDLSNKRVTPAFLKAFYINAYNILVIKQVVDFYPVESPKDVPGFFEEVSHKVMGEEMTLDELEKEVLFKQFSDPRLHFVLVCAAKGCPPLASYSYHPEKLEEQLSKRTSEVLNLDWFIRVKENKVEISRIFAWYREDFTKDNGSVLEYINQYREQKIGKSKEIDFYEYDWSLNDK